MQENRSMPESTIIPVLEYPDVRAAMKWLEAAFAFEVRLSIGDHRAQLQFGVGAIVVAKSQRPEIVLGQGHSVMVRVDGIEAHLSRALAHGAELVQPLADFPFGERQYTCRDLAGHRWTFSQTIANVDPADWGGKMAPDR
jgi:uncharacterized glyoxalase superfamily protein PhnB